MSENSVRTTHADISIPRALSAGALLLVPLVGGALSTHFVDDNAALLVAGATPFVIVEVAQKLIEFLLHGKQAKDWFADRFEQVRVPAALVSGSFIAGTQAIEHYRAALIGLAVFAAVLFVIRILRPRST